MKNLGSIVLTVALVSLFNTEAVYAQLAPPEQQSAPAQRSTLPVSSREVFPRLPTSNVCTKEKLVGVWKLVMLYEVPPSREMESYVTHPLQFYVFEADTQSGEFRSVIRNINLYEIRDLVLANTAAVRQFAVNQSGMVFFYKNSIAVDSLACFIVAGNYPPFRIGQMLLMPPEKAAAGVRMLRVYEKAFLEFESQL